MRVKINDTTSGAQRDLFNSCETCGDRGVIRQEIGKSARTGRVKYQLVPCPYCARVKKKDILDRGL